MEELKSNYLIFLIILNKFIASVHFYALINSNSSVISFINADFAILYYFPL